MDFKDFWYIAAESKDVKGDRPFATQIMDEWIVLFRDADGKASALRDNCIHRCARLSKGTVKNGRLECPYHGWTYNGRGHVVSVPSEGQEKTGSSGRKTVSYPVTEIDHYIYVRLNRDVAVEHPPFRIPEYGKKGWKTIRLVNRFENNVTNCAENFVDIPHTVSVHPKIFRVAKNEKIQATVTRKEGTVFVRYLNEKTNLGFFSWFLNPDKKEIVHTDAFYMPNITSVRYQAGTHREFIITSQSVPVSEEETLVYTDLTYDYGIWNFLSGPIVRNQAQTIIDQDIEILKIQMEGIRKYGAKFQNSEADVIHVMIESIRNEIAKGGDPKLLPEKNHEIQFYV